MTSLPQDEYLTPEEVAKLHDILTRQLEDLMTNSREAIGELVGDKDNEVDELDIAVTQSSREFNLRMADRERRYVGQVQRALTRIRDGEHGTCETCGDAIGMARLLARPTATECIDCRTQAETSSGR